MGLDDFDLEPSEHEPDEWDPEDDLHDPDAPGLTIPAVETSESDAPSEVVQTFWIVVLVVNAALFLISVGPMVIYFEGWVREGVAMVVAGVVLFGLAYRRYRAFEAASPGSESHESKQSSAETEEGIDRTSNDATDRPDSSDSPDTHEDSS